MEKYNDLELIIMSCLLQRPELMKKAKLKNHHFVKHEKLWIFMKAIYERFGCFDIPLMATVAKNKYKLMEYIEMIIEKEPAPSNFEKYQDLLINMYEQKKKDNFIKEKIYKLATDLYVGNIDIEKFEMRYKGTLYTADEVFGKE